MANANISIAYEYERRECDKCKDALMIVRKKVDDGHGPAIAMEIATGNRHVCWNLPEDANLIVIDD
jgi:hypothetical protein